MKKKKEEERREKKKIKVWKLNLKPFLMIFDLGKTLTLHNNDACWSQLSYMVV